jgi:DNA-binding transcriptional regulator YiaG
MRLTDPDSTSRSQSWRARTAGNVRCRSAAGLLRPLTATFESAPAIPAPPRCFGTDIRDLRGETQQELGRLLGWSVSTVSRFEAAAERPDQATHRRYCALAPTSPRRH